VLICFQYTEKWPKSRLSVVYIGEPCSEENDDTISREMAFDQENLKKLVESPVYKSAAYYNALKYIH
jgi:hypothetical protein